MTPALLFDMDGTLVDTEHLHFSAFQTILSPHGVELSWADYRQFIMGHPNHAIAAHFLPHVAEEHHAGLMDDKEARYRSLVTDVSPSEGLMDLLDWADAEGIPYAVVTNAPRANAELVLEALKIRSRFKAVVAGDEVERPKPHPSPTSRQRRLSVEISPAPWPSRIPARGWPRPWRRAFRSLASLRRSMKTASRPRAPPC